MSTVLEPEIAPAAPAEGARHRIIETIRTLHGRNGGLAKLGTVQVK